MRLDESFREYLGAGVATIVGTASNEGIPQIAYGWGLRLHDDGETLDVFLDTARSAPSRTNLAENGRIAVTTGDPVSYRSIQLKGAYLEDGEPTEADRKWVDRSRQAFLVKALLLGDPPATIRNLWLEDVWRVTFRAEGAFDQTPGPEAGKPL